MENNEEKSVNIVWRDAAQVRESKVARWFAELSTRDSQVIHRLLEDPESPLSMAMKSIRGQVKQCQFVARLGKQDMTDIRARTLQGQLAEVTILQTQAQILRQMLAESEKGKASA